MISNSQSEGYLLASIHSDQCMCCFSIARPAEETIHRARRVQRAALGAMSARVLSQSGCKVNGIHQAKTTLPTTIPMHKHRVKRIYRLRRRSSKFLDPFCQAILRHQPERRTPATSSCHLSDKEAAAALIPDLCQIWL